MRHAPGIVCTAEKYHAAWCVDRASAHTVIRYHLTFILLTVSGLAIWVNLVRGGPSVLGLGSLSWRTEYWALLAEHFPLESRLQPARYVLRLRGTVSGGAYPAARARVFFFVSRSLSNWPVFWPFPKSNLIQGAIRTRSGIPLLAGLRTKVYGLQQFTTRSIRAFVGPPREGVGAHLADGRVGRLPFLVCKHQYTVDSNYRANRPESAVASG